VFQKAELSSSDDANLVHATKPLLKAETKMINEVQSVDLQMCELIDAKKALEYDFVYSPIKLSDSEQGEDR
jgi:hypothetical protein